MEILIGLYLRKSIPNVITSGYFLRNGGLASTVTSSIKDLLLTDPWQYLFMILPLPAFLFILTHYSLIQKQTDQLFIQLTGLPSLYSIPSKPKAISFSLNSILYRTGFSRHCGLPGKNPLNQIWKLNVRLNECTHDAFETGRNRTGHVYETTKPTNRSTEYAFRRVRRDIVQVLVHESLRDCYSKWSTKSLKEELEDVEKHVLESQPIHLLKTPSRFAEYERYLGRLLLQSQLVDYHGLLNHYAKLPNYQSRREIHPHLEDVMTQESIPVSRRMVCHPSESTHLWENLIKMTVPPQRVYDFIADCLRRIVAKQLIGSRHNWHILMKRIYQLLFSEYGDELTIDQIVDKMRLSEIHWIQPRGKPTAKENIHSLRLFKSFLVFLFRVLIVGTSFFLYQDSIVFKSFLCHIFFIFNHSLLS